MSWGTHGSVTAEWSLLGCDNALFGQVVLKNLLHGHLDPWRQWHYTTTICWESLAQWYSITHPRRPKSYLYFIHNKLPSSVYFSLFFFTFMWPCITTNFFIMKPTGCTNFTSLFWQKLYMFRTVPLSIIRSLFTVHWAMVYVIQVCRQLSSRTRMELVWHIPVPSVQWINSWWWAQELPEIYRVSCRSKFGKLVHLVGFIIKKILSGYFIFSWRNFVSS